MREPGQERCLLRHGQIMKHIEKRNVAGESRNRPLDISMAKIDLSITSGRDLSSLANFPRIEIESENRLPAAAFAQIKRQQTDATADIQHRFGRATEQFVSGGIDGIAPEFAPHIATKPALWKLGGDAGARRLMFADVATPVFHLLRIIALPD